jgi:class 3 adenylate cyclase/tetratricopeptide (TPR) repeat protein
MTDSYRDGQEAYLSALCRAVPYHLVERVLEDPSDASTGTQRFEGSVLYADLVGFTALCEGLTRRGVTGLSVLSAFLDRFFSLLLEDAIFPQGGYVIQFGGDSITAVFRGENHQHHAAAAALRCRDVVEQELARLTVADSRAVMIRVGVASGRVRLEVIGDMLRKSSVCAGAVAHRAYSIQSRADPNTIRVDLPTAEALKDVAVLKPQTDDTEELFELNLWPEERPIEPLGERIRSQVNEKIARLEPFLPAPLAQRLKTSPSGGRIAPELRHAVVLFLEIRGYGKDQHNPEKTKPLYSSLLRTYRKYGGMVSKVDLADDGFRVLVLFGVHRPSPSDPERAVLAGLEAITRVQGYLTAHDLPFDFRSGVHQGQVFFGAIGSDYKHDITVVSDAVNVAARTCSTAAPYSCQITESIANDIGENFVLSEKRSIALKGKDKPMPLYTVHSTREQTARYMQKRKYPRFSAGREMENAALEALVDQAMAGEGVLLGLSGGPGTGKSFLLSSLVDRWIEQGGLGIVTRCRYTDNILPLAPVIHMFENFLGVAPGDSHERRTEAILHGLKGFKLGPSKDALVSLLQPIRTPNGNIEIGVDLSDPHLREALFSGIVSFVEQRIDQDPVLYVVEDLHHADAHTVDLMMRISRISRAGRFLMVGTYQPESHLRETRRLFDMELALSNLSIRQTEDVLCHEMGCAEAHDALTLFLWHRTDGNPGHLVETIRFLKERNLIQIRAGMAMAPDAGLAVLEDVVPAGVAQVALARLDDLGESERRLLRTASAIGRRFGHTLLADVHANANTHLDDEEPEPGPDLDSMLDVLKGQNILAEEQESENHILFRDEVTRAVTYNTIPAARRRATHRRIADVLEELPISDPAHLPVTLAFHRERAEQWDEALFWYAKATEQAAKAGLDQETAELAKKWESVLGQVPEERRPGLRERARVMVRRLVAVGRLGEASRILTYARRIRFQYMQVLTETEAQQVEFWTGRGLMMMGRVKKAYEKLERVFHRTDSPALKFDAAVNLARLAVEQRYFDEAEEWLLQVEKAGVNDVARKAEAELVRAELAFMSGKRDGALDRMELLCAELEDQGQMQLLARARAELARGQLEVGDYAGALRSLRESTVLDRALGSWEQEARHRTWLGAALFFSGRADEALTHLNRALALAESLSNAPLKAEAEVHRGAALAVVSDPSAGKAQLKAGILAAREMELTSVVALGLLHLMRLAIHEGDRRGRQRVEAQLRELPDDAHTPLFEKVLGELRQKREDERLRAL